jgi:hypothetical protein
MHSSPAAPLVTRLSPLAQRVASVVYLSSPAVVCMRCLAGHAGLREHDVRGIALVLITRARLQLVQAACDSCRRTDDALVADLADVTA